MVATMVNFLTAKSGRRKHVIAYSDIVVGEGVALFCYVTTLCCPLVLQRATSTRYNTTDDVLISI